MWRSIPTILVYIAGNQAFEGYNMRLVKATEFAKDFQYQAAKRQARRNEIGRRSGRRGTTAWGQWPTQE